MRGTSGSLTRVWTERPPRKRGPRSRSRYPAAQGTRERASARAGLRLHLSVLGQRCVARARWQCHRADPQRQRHHRFLVCSRCTSGKSMWPGRDVWPHRTPAAGGPRAGSRGPAHPGHTRWHTVVLSPYGSLSPVPRGHGNRERGAEGVWTGEEGNGLWLTILPEGYALWVSNLGQGSSSGWSRAGATSQGARPGAVHNQLLGADGAGYKPASGAGPGGLDVSHLLPHSLEDLLHGAPEPALSPESPQGGWELGQPSVPGLELADQPGRVCSLPTRLPCTRRQGPPVFSTVTSPTVSRAKGESSASARVSQGGNRATERHRDSPKGSGQ